MVKDDQQTDPKRRIARLVSIIMLATLGLLAVACATSPVNSVSSATPSSVPAGKTRFFTPQVNSFSHPYLSARVTFTAGETFIEAMRTVTDLGLQPLYYCAAVSGDTAWHPLGEQAGFAQDATLETFATPDAPVGWLIQLNATHTVRAIYDGPDFCPNPAQVTPSPGMGFFTGMAAYPSFVGVPVQARFKEEESYDQALTAISNLGFRLANPCYEKAKQVSANIPWQSPGQEQAFSTSHMLVIATTNVVSTLWRSQLLATPSATGYTQPYEPQCLT